MLLRNSRVAVIHHRPVSTSSRVVVPLVWDDDILPADESRKNYDEELDPEQPMRASRYYIPPPLSDSQLASVSSAVVAEWPKSRVVWALGRSGFVPELRRNKHLFETLAECAIPLTESMNSRDLVRVIQAAAYGAGGTKMHALVQLTRKKFATNIARSNELFLASFVYGTLKLVNRAEWTLTENCFQCIQFLLAELIHRVDKIYAPHFLDIGSCLVAGCKPEILQRNADAVETIIKHCIENALKHCKQTSAIDRFALALFGSDFQLAEKYFTRINEFASAKFRKGEWKNGQDALDCGFWFSMNGLVSPATADMWITAVKEAKIPVPVNAGNNTASSRTCLNNLLKIRLMLNQVEIEQNNLVSTDNKQWLTDLAQTNAQTTLANVYGTNSKELPIITADMSRVSRVLRHIAEATVDTPIESILIGPFWVPLFIPAQHTVIEWEQPWLLEPPHRRNYSKKITALRRAYLTRNEYRLVLLDQSEFRASSEEAKKEINNKFVTKMHAHGIPTKETPDPPQLPKKFPSQQFDTSPNPKRIRREAKRTENALKATLRRISKSWVTKQHKKKKLRSD